MRAALLFFALAAPTSLLSAQAAVNWRVGPLAAGSWTYRSLPDGSEAAFMDARVTPRVVVKCSRATRVVTLTLATAVRGSTITLATTEAERSIPASFNAQTSQIIAQIAGTDAILDALAFSRGRFAVTAGGGATLVVPAWPEVARSIEDCRI